MDDEMPSDYQRLNTRIDKFQTETKVWQDSFSSELSGLKSEMQKLQELIKALPKEQAQLQAQPQANTKYAQRRRFLEALSLTSDVSAVVILAGGLILQLGNGTPIFILILALIALVVFIIIVRLINDHVFGKLAREEKGPAITISEAN